MSARRALVLLAGALGALGAHELLLAFAARAHVAHALLAAGNGPPPIGAAALAFALVVVRLLAIVLVPGLVLASLASLFAHVAVGPPDVGAAGGADTPTAHERRQGDGAGSGTSSGAGISVEDGTGSSIEGRGTA